MVWLLSGAISEAWAVSSLPVFVVRVATLMRGDHASQSAVGRMDLRNHRKIAVIDNCIAFGGREPGIWIFCPDGLDRMSSDLPGSIFKSLNS